MWPPPGLPQPPADCENAIAFVPAPSVAQFDAVYATPGGGAENVHHMFHIDGSDWTATQLATAGLAIVNWNNAVLVPRQTAAIALQHVHCRDLATQFGPETDVVGGNVGTLGGAALPNNVTIALKKVTGLSGRGFRGRIYHIGCSEGKQSNDGYDATEVAALVAAYDGLISAVDAIGNTHYCILHAKQNGATLNPRVPVRVLSFQSVDTTLDSQRRRLLGHNRHR